MRFTGTDRLLIEPLSLNAVAATNSIFPGCLSVQRGRGCTATGIGNKMDGAVLPLTDSLLSFNPSFRGPFSHLASPLLKAFLSLFL